MQRIESFFDEIFGAAANPWRHLGALGFYFLWIALATGIYLFIVLDTGIEEIMPRSSTTPMNNGGWAASSAACTAMPPTAWCW